MASAMTECRKCGKSWGGYNTVHCTGCHFSFTTQNVSDKHRAGSHARDTRHCLPPDSVGLIDAGRGYPCWGFPGDDKEWWGDEESH